MGQNSTRNLGSYTFNSFNEGIQKFTTNQSIIIDPLGNNLLWRLQYGEGEVDISIEDVPGNSSLMIFSFAGNNMRHIFKYDQWTQIMDASQAAGMSFSVDAVDEDATFKFRQPKELTPLGTAELDWTIIAEWDFPVQGYPVKVSVAVTPILTSTSSPLVSAIL